MVHFLGEMSSAEPSQDLANVTLCAYRQACERKATDGPAQRVAVEVRRVKLSYGRGKNAKPILTEIGLTVPEGAM